MIHPTSTESDTGGTRPFERLSDGPRAALLSILVLLGCVAYGASTFPLEFNTNDDAAMLGISLGLFSDQLGDPRLVHQSAFLGVLIGGLFRVAPHFDWYSATQWLLCLGAFGSIGFVLLRRDRSWLGLACFASVASVYFSPILFQLQFTQTSFACVAASAVLLLDGLSRERPSRRMMGAALAFGVLGALVRSVNMIAAELVLVVVSACLAAYWLQGGDRRRALVCVCAVLGFGCVLGAVVIGLRSAEAALFYADPGWSEFWRSHAERAFVLDQSMDGGGFRRVARVIEERLAITPHQLLAMMHGLPIAKSLYSPEGFSQMASVIREIESSSSPFSDRLAGRLPEIREFVTGNAIFAHSLVLIVFIACLRAIQRPSTALKSIAVGVLWAGFALALVAGISTYFRLPPYRVWMPLSMLCVLGSLACHAMLESSARARTIPTTRSSSIERRAQILIAGLFGVGVLWLAPLHRDFRVEATERAGLQAQLCAMTEAHVRAFRLLPDGARIFVAPGVVLSECYLKPFQTTYPVELQDRVINFGWRNLTPWIRDELFVEQNGLFDVICADPRNMFVLHPIDWPNIEGYLRRHEPGVVLATYSSQLPPAILSCRRDVQTSPKGRLIGVERTLPISMNGSVRGSVFP